MTNPSQEIDKQITGLSDWRGDVYKKLRNIINKADSGLVEEVKWGSGVWVKNGNVCAVCAMKNHVKMNFFQGASLADPEKLFNAGLDAKKTRAIDFHKDDKINEDALTKLIQAAVSEIGKK